MQYSCLEWVQLGKPMPGIHDDSRCVVCRSGGLVTISIVQSTPPWLPHACLHWGGPGAPRGAGADNSASKTGGLEPDSIPAMFTFRHMYVVSSSSASLTMRIRMEVVGSKASYSKVSSCKLHYHVISSICAQNINLRQIWTTQSKLQPPRAH